MGGRVGFCVHAVARMSLFTELFFSIDRGLLALSQFGYNSLLLSALFAETDA